MSTVAEISRQYPKKVSLSDRREFTIRLMEPTEGDRIAVSNFASGLREEDLLYLRTDIGDPAAITTLPDTNSAMPGCPPHAPASTAPASDATVTAA